MRRVMSTLLHCLFRFTSPPVLGSPCTNGASHDTLSLAPPSVYLANKHFSFCIDADELDASDLLAFTVNSGAVNIRINTSHAAARFLLNTANTPGIPLPTAMLCAALVALELEAPNTKRRGFNHDARVDLDRILRQLAPFEEEM